MIEATRRLKVWNRDFILLWQGQLVSMVGTTAFNIALGFWILRETGSSAVMGVIIAIGALVQAGAGPFAGVLVDRWSRKRIIVASDLASGAIVLVGAVLAFLGVLEVWMVGVGAVGVALATAIFAPAVSSSIPDLVPADSLDRGNSAFGIIQQLSGIIGNSLGGTLFTLLGAPVVFLINGMTFIASAVSEAFMRLPHVRRTTETAAPAGEDPAGVSKAIAGTPGVDGRLRAFGRELASGFRFVWSRPVLRLQMLNIGTLNLFLSMGGVLYLPYFERSEVFAAADYGLTMAVMTGGALLGLLLLQLRSPAPSKRFPIFAVLAMVFGLSRTLIVSFPVLPLILALAFAGGFSVSIINTILLSTFQSIVPPDMRGKVFGLLGSFAGALMPLGLAIGGVLGDLVPITLVVPITGAVATIGFLPLLLNRDVARAYGAPRPATGGAGQAGEAEATTETLD